MTEQTTPTTIAATTAPAANTAPPATTAEAKARLDELTNSKEWGAKILAGDGDARKEWSALCEMIATGNQVDAVLNGTALPDPTEMTTAERPLNTYQQLSAVESLRTDGLRDEVIREVLTDREVSREEHALAQRLQNLRHGDEEWRRKLLAGDAETKREQLLMSVILSATVKGQG